jgi:hypothetical protein
MQKDHRKQLEDLNLKEGDKPYYQKNNIKLDRVTHYLQEQFSGKADSEMFILNSMYADFNKKTI